VSTSPTYRVRIKASAEREMDSLPPEPFDRISRAILRLELTPRPHGSKKLGGREEYRLRVGVYRILYDIDDARRIVRIVAVRHRKDAYRGGT
jgi:mRNA interferase RelE/StbE